MFAHNYQTFGFRWKTENPNEYQVFFSFWEQFWNGARVWIIFTYSDYIHVTVSHAHTHTHKLAGWWTSAQADNNENDLYNIAVMFGNAHLQYNTHLEGLYAVAMNRDECNYLDSEFTMYTQLFLQTEGTTGELFVVVLFFFLKEMKWVYSACETLYQKVRRCQAPHDNLKKKKKGVYCTCTPKLKAERSFRRLLCFAWQGGAAEMSSKQQSSCDKKRGISLFLC